MKILSISYRKLCCVIQQFHNKTVNEQRLLTSLSCLSLKSLIFNKRNTCLYVRVMLLRYYTLVFLIHISIQYFLCNVAKHILSLQYVTGFESMASYVGHRVTG